MKNYSITKNAYWFILLILGAGCQKLEETPKSSLASSTFYKTQGDLDAATASIFYYMTRPWNSFDNAGAFATTFGGDDVISLSDALPTGIANKLGFQQFDVFKASSTNDRMPSLWNLCWNSIRQCNDVIENYQQVNASETVKNQYAAIAYFARAFCYFTAVRTWGDLPIITKGMNATDLPSREPVSKVYELIVADLQWAEQYLPKTWPGQPGKPSLGASKALLAKVYLTMAGWPLKETQYYSDAATKAKEVMELGVYDLWADYADAFKVANNNGKESVFALQFNVEAGLEDHTNGRACQPGDEGGGWDDYFSEIQFYKDYPESPRKRACFYDTFNVVVSGIRQKIPYTQGRSRHPYYRKFRDTYIDESKPEEASYYGSKCRDFIRLADVLLIYAEASAMAANGPTTESYESVNRVRRRAGLADLAPGLDQIAFRDAVVQERAWELAGEFQRWYDLLRLEIVEQVTARRDPTEDPVGPITKDKYLAPIPNYELLTNPNLKQNPGY
jgi:starch-binding outer membrane protein, SusD/RagB family